MKYKITTTVIVLILAFLFNYLIGSFFSVSFNIAKWTEDTRLVICICYFISLYIGVIIYAMCEDFKKQKS